MSFKAGYWLIRQIFQNNVNISNYHFGYDPDITIDKKTLFFKHYFDNWIRYICDACNTESSYLSFHNLNTF